MNNLHFKVSTELKTILGRDMITSDNIAVLELVKNSYDAHATKVEITFGSDTLVISDNGKGMSHSDIINKWLFVGYSAKRDGTEDKDYRNKFSRNYAGAKGIGRLSCDRLAQNLVLTTKNENETLTQRLYVDWTAFEMNQKEEFNEVTVPQEAFSDIPNFPGSSQTGTILRFSNLRTIWTKEMIQSLRKSLEKMINPFSETSTFDIEIFAPEFIDFDNSVRMAIKDIEASEKKAEDKEVEIACKKCEIINGYVHNSISEILSLKTTQIESCLKDDKIITTLSDRGTLMYKIEENNKYLNLGEVTINLFYLNRAAKYNFTARMGVNVANYGNIFLFRNGFRIYPYGEVNDDSWGLNERFQRGFKRYLGTRDLLGRVDVETNDVNDFKEVSSRDGGLIETPASADIMTYFTDIHRRLERYVVGVLWGESFLRNDYFNDTHDAIKQRERLQEMERMSDTANHIFSSIGSKVDFLQLVKSLVNDDNISVLEYNKELANIVNSVGDTQIIHEQFMNDLRKVASKTNDSDLEQKIDIFEKELNRQREISEFNRKKAEEEERKRKEAENKAHEEEQLRKKAEKELDLKTKQNLFLQSVGSLDLDRILQYHHDIRIQAQTIQNVLDDIATMVIKGSIDVGRLGKKVELSSRANAKILSISRFATKANFNTSGETLTADIVEFVLQYTTLVLPDYYNDITLHCNTNGCVHLVPFKPLEVSLIIDNLLANSIKAKAKNFYVDFRFADRLTIEIRDDGQGLSDDIKNPQSVFEKGVTTTNGSGLGLYNVALYVKNSLSGTIIVDESYDAQSEQGKGFKLILTI